AARRRRSGAVSEAQVWIGRSADTSSLAFSPVARVKMSDKAPSRPPPPEPPSSSRASSSRSSGLTLRMSVTCSPLLPLRHPPARYLAVGQHGVCEGQTPVQPVRADHGNAERPRGHHEFVTGVPHDRPRQVRVLATVEAAQAADEVPLHAAAAPADAHRL